MTASGAVDEVGIFIGANRQAHVFDYKDNLVAYGAYTTVALWNPFSIDKKGVYRTLVKHTKEVTCVRFIPGTDLLVSAGEDGEINVWKKSGDTYNLIQTLVEEDVSITCISVFDKHYFVTGNTRGEVSVYKIEDNRISLAYRYKVKFNFFALTLCLQKIDTAYLLLIGGTGTSLFVYTFTPTEGPKLQASKLRAALFSPIPNLCCLLVSKTSLFSSSTELSMLSFNLSRQRRMYLSWAPEARR